MYTLTCVSHEHEARAWPEGATPTSVMRASWLASVTCTRPCGECSGETTSHPWMYVSSYPVKSNRPERENEHDEAVEPHFKGS